ncbi:MAG: hypothetical protein ACFCU7_12240 [Pleurocapsa sp.]
MTQESDNGKNNFLYPKASYHGDFSPNEPNNLVFNANLQEFAQKVAYICALETNGKISTEEAYNQIKKLWHQLKTTKKALLEQDDSE